MLAASFETSEPEMFIAMPRSAFFSAGESLTPSPVLQGGMCRYVSGGPVTAQTYTPTM